MFHETIHPDVVLTEIRERHAHLRRQAEQARLHREHRDRHRFRRRERHRPRQR